MGLPFAGSIAIRAMKDADYQATVFPGTTAGLQAAVDYLAGGKGKVSIGPGTLLTTTAIWLHTGCHIEGSGIGVTVVKRSSMANGDAANSGAVFVTSALGSNGTLNGSGSSQANICITDLTVDGNHSSFGAVTDANLVPSGIRLDYTDGVRILRVRCQNVLGDGFRVRFCRNVYLSQVETDTVGQWGTVAARNAINFIGDYNASGNWGYNYNLKGASLITTGDEAIQASGIMNMTISDVVIDGCDFVFESNAGSGNAAGTTGNWTITNLTATNTLSYFITLSPAGTGQVHRNIIFSNCTVTGHPTLHDGGVVAFPTGTGNLVSGFTMSYCTVDNINTLDTTTRHWLDSQPADVSGNSNIRILGCSFSGKAGSARTGSEVGLNFRGSHSNVVVAGVVIKDMAGTAVRLNDTTSYAGTIQRGMSFSDVIVDTCNDFAYRITSTAGSSTASYSDVHFVNCIAKDCSAVTSGAAWQMFISQAGASISGVFLVGCRAYKTSGSSLTYGLDLTQSAGTLSQITVSACDFSGTATNWFNSSGTVTDIHFTPPSGRGSDIASAATIAIPQNGSVFHVTGSTDITNGITVKPWDNGRTVYLIFDSTPTVSDTGTSKLRAAFVATAGDVLPLVCDGTNWYQAAFESVN